MTTPPPRRAAGPRQGWLRRLGSSGNVPRALRWGTVESTGLVVSAALVGPLMASYALLGVQTAQAGWLSPLRPRLARLAGAGVAVLAGETLGMVVADHHLLVPLAMGVFTWLVMWFWHALRLGSPGPVNLVMGAAMGTYMGWNERGVRALLVMTTLGLVLVSVLSVLVLLVFDHLPEREAVSQAADDVDALLAAGGEREDPAGGAGGQHPGGRRRDVPDVGALRRRA